jgi:hypothetical protein
MASKSEIIIYQTPKGDTKIDVLVKEETVWITQVQMTELFQTTKQNISLHIKNIYEEGELETAGTVKEYLTVQQEGKRNVKLHGFLTLNDRDILNHTGKVSHQEAEEYAFKEYEKYKSQLKANEIDELDKSMKQLKKGKSDDKNTNKLFPDDF